MTAGYIDPETQKLYTSDVGTPQGSVLSPLLCNIVLHELDQYLENIKQKFNKGTRRRPNPSYAQLNSKRRYLRNESDRRKILHEMRKLLTSDPKDPNYKKLKYVRYADDFVVLVIGSHKDALEIRSKIKNFIARECGLTLNLEKTAITNIQKSSFHFLGADCSRAVMTKNHVVKRGKITVRATTRLRVNIDLQKVYKKLISSGLAK